MNHLKTVIALCTSALLGTGCTISGTPDLSCPDPEQGVCTDAYTAFKLAEQGKSAKDYDGDAHIGHEGGSRNHVHDEDHHDSGLESSQNINNADSQYRDMAPIAGLMRMPATQPKPALMQATVLEGWVNVWEDQNGTLRLPSTVLIEVTPRRWSLDGTKVEEFKTQGPFVTTSGK